jgi:hypothetical protein
MDEQVQKTLDTIQSYMENASRQTYSGPAGTRVLQTLVTMLARHCLTVEQQRQVETIIDLHDACLNYNEVPKKFVSVPQRERKEPE